MSIEVIKCPACAATLDVDGKSEFIKCGHCGNTLRLKITNRPPQEPALIKFVDKALNIPLGSVELPADQFVPTGAVMPEAASNAYPMPIRCGVGNKFGTALSFFTGEGYIDDTKCPLLSSSYATVVNQISKIRFKPFMNAEQYANYYINQLIQTAKMTNAWFLENRPFPASGYNRKEALDSFIRLCNFKDQMAGTGNAATGKMYYLEESCKVYEVDVGPIKMRIVVAFILRGYRYQLPAMFGMGGGFMGGMFGFGPRPQYRSNGAQPGTFGDMPNNAAIEWSSNGVFTMMCPKERFDEDYKEFVQFASSFQMDSYIVQESIKMQEQMIRDVANYTQQNIAQQNANFQAMQQANRSLQEAFDSANQAWWNRSNAHHAQVMASSRSTFGESSADRISRMQSEAIRGVNTYQREDGSTVEVSVDYDHAYSNKLGDTLATNSSFEPGGNWDAMNRL
ncbi:hypothetical protein SAMN02910264_02079 [Ruminococcaceae bacterium YAD3003]|nr:hypothetical protein SAMN02910264_02079 [Ruminococcaceae bacterium YAD3003]